MIAKKIIAERGDYWRCLEAALEAVKIIEDNMNRLALPDAEKRQLHLIKNFFENAPDEDRLIEESIKRYKDKVRDFKPSNYEL
jgi:hypothetical protein